MGLSQEESHRLTEASRRYADRGISLPVDLEPRLRRLVAPYALADLDRHGTAEGLVGAWRATRDAPRESEDRVWLVLLRMFHSRFSEFVPGLKEALREHRMTLTKTRVQVNLQLASRCFFIGRRLDARDKGSPPGHFLLDECTQVLREVLRYEDAVPPQGRRQLRGQLATALTILSRCAAQEAVVALLVEAETHAGIVEELGDRTDAHFAYRAEIGLRLYNATKDEAHLERARAVALAVGGTRSKRLHSVAADAIAELGFARTRSGDLGEAVELLSDAERRYGEALVLAPDMEDGVDDGYLLAKRAQLRNQLYRIGDSHGRRDSRLLDRALTDWLDARAVPHRHDPSVVVALLDRARVRARRNDRPGATADRELARGLLPSGGAPQADAKLRAADLERAAEDAAAVDDLARLQAVVSEMIQLPPDALIPAAALAQASKVLAQALPEEQWRPLVTAALTRIEADLGHPSMTGPVVRHVAGHAALLAWLLARRTRDPDLLGRTVQLYRTAFAALDVAPPSVDSLVNAGACALVLGRMFLAGDEADAEEAAGLFAEGLSWLETGLARAQTGSAVVRGDFDTVMVHSRLGEIALRLYPLTWDANHLDTAIEHLNTARGLGQDAPELTGLLGDAYYRRGVGQRAYEDLERAIALKDEVFESGVEQRENRSLTAAAALRLSTQKNDDRLLTDAARRALQAARCDPAWPWPVLQLADLADRAPLPDADDLASAEPQKLATLVLYGQRAELLRHAADLAVHSEEFIGSILGGQKRSGERGVRVLNDPHRLLEQTIVLKRLGHDDAHREHDDTVRFRDWLTAAQAPASWTLPEPLAVVDLPDGDSVYVMRRAHARLLEASVVDWHNGHGSDPRARFREALRYLAAFQAWRARSDNRFPRVCGLSERAAFHAQLDKLSRNLGVSDEIRRLLGAACERFAAEGTPAVAKKDPHPGNWLWTRRGELVLIDIEATIALPLLREAATIIDDLPLLDMTTRGWGHRASLCRDYLDALAEFGLPHMDDRDRLMERYEAMAALHAVKGLGRLRHADRGVSSSSLKALRLQADHYGALLDHLATAAIRPEVRELAAALREWRRAQSGPVGG